MKRAPNHWLVWSPSSPYASSFVMSSVASAELVADAYNAASFGGLNDWRAIEFAPVDESALTHVGGYRSTPINEGET